MNATGYNAEDLTPLMLYADNHLLALNKPPDLLTQDSGTGKRNLENWAREWVRQEKSKPGRVFLNAVHRIDKAVSGVVLLARTGKALARLNEGIRRRDCRKIYHALVEGQPPEPAAELVHWLRHEAHRAGVCREGDTGAQRAVLRYKTLEAAEPYSLLEIDLQTGRYHQIRAQLAAIGCPVAGDWKYGATGSDAQRSGIALHHRLLQVVHPTTRETLAIRAPYPAGSKWWTQR
jgi:23S rRNA pseudouridine1911/1915/1917 synthase